MREIPKKNYLFLLGIILAVMLITLYLADLHKKQDDSNYESVMNTFITEVKSEDLEEIMANNPTIVLFVSDKSDESLRPIEQEIKDLLVANNLQKYFVYLDVSPEEGIDLTEFEANRDIDLDYNNLPIFIVVVDKVIVGILNESNLKIDKINLFLIATGVIESE